ncbi:MAG: DmsC/YnfH family molybdoenzyme membrane anchor subunit [Planctomycetaceae bacterium]
MTATLPILEPPAEHLTTVRRIRPLARERVDSLEPPAGGDLVAALLADQANLTAVERFSRFHESSYATPPERRYTSLLPASPPGPGQQYAFEVDLDLCSGCKACVTACHTLNGLDDGEAWRDVGLLQGGTPDLPVVQHVTTACHHCLDPACANACPVDAYEKDPKTGIVRHLDDQCFGCQYCTLACPYDVPKYHKGKGIVRKCDLCRGRLAVGEAPACAQACPHEAIRVALVDVARVAEDCEANAFLPGAPDPDYTLPTTVYKTARALPRNLLPADYFDVRPEHAHWPLVVMLVLTQLSVGGFIAALVLNAGRTDAASPVHAIVSLAFGLLALTASTLHLGRPHLAFRALIGLRHSWLSREVVAFGAFAPLAAAYAGLTWLSPDWYAARRDFQSTLAAAVAITGLVGVGSGVMVYHVVRRAFWHAGRSGVKFFGTTVLLGLSATLLIDAARTAFGEPNVATSLHSDRQLLCFAITAVAVGKLLFEASAFVRLRETRFTSLRRTALLMTGPLADVTWLRFVLGMVGGIALPLLLGTSDADSTPEFLLGASLVSFLALLGGELAERYLFFTAVVRQKMPGGLGV